MNTRLEEYIGIVIATELVFTKNKTHGRVVFSGVTCAKFKVAAVEIETVCTPLGIVTVVPLIAAKSNVDPALPPLTFCNAV